MDLENCKLLVLRYFKAWKDKDWDQMRDCLSTNFTIDAGQIQFNSVNAFISFCINGPSLSEIKLLEAFFLENKAALLYEGTTSSGEKIRIGEFLELDQNKIVSSKASISLG